MILQISRNEAEAVRGHISPIIQGNILSTSCFRVPTWRLRGETHPGKDFKNVAQGHKQRGQRSTSGLYNRSPSSKRGRGHKQGGQRPTSGLYKHSPFSRRGQGHKQRGQKWLHQDYIIMRRKILLTHHRDIFPSPEAYSKEKNAIEPWPSNQYQCEIGDCHDLGHDHDRDTNTSAEWSSANVTGSDVIKWQMMTDGY